MDSFWLILLFLEAFHAEEGCTGTTYAAGNSLNLLRLPLSQYHPDTVSYRILLLRVGGGGGERFDVSEIILSTFTYFYIYPGKNNKIKSRKDWKMVALPLKKSCGGFQGDEPVCYTC